jgi:hypothetical protein
MRPETVFETMPPGVALTVGVPKLIVRRFHDTKLRFGGT